MKIYIKPEISTETYHLKEHFADQWSDLFGTGNQIPISVFTLGDDTSIA